MEEKVQGSENVDVTEFRHSMFQALEKYGVLDKLRVHLRTLMVNLIKGFQIGQDPFPQYRLEPKNQALNVLIAEYLLHQRYTYSLSVFASEIPLSTTVFDYGTTLFGMSAKFEENASWKFISLNDKDIALVFNAMGVPSESNFVSSVYSMYKSTLPQTPLLCCMLKMLPECSKGENKDTSGATEILSDHQKANKRDCKISNTLSTKTDAIKKKATVSPTRKRVSNSGTKERIKSSEKMKNIEPERDIDKHILEEMYEELHLLYASELDLLRKKDKKKYMELLSQKEIEDRFDKLEQEESIKQFQVKLQNEYDKNRLKLESEMKKKKKSLSVLAGKLKEQQETLRGALQHLHKRTSSLGEKEKNLHKQKDASEQAMIKKSEQLQNKIQEKMDDLQRQMEYLEKEKKMLYEEKILIEQFKGVSISRKDSGSQTFDDLKVILQESTLNESLPETSLRESTKLPLLERSTTKVPIECESQTEISNINSVLMEITSNSLLENDLSNSTITRSNIRVFGRDETISMLNTRVSDIIQDSYGLGVPKVINNNLKNNKINNMIMTESQNNETDAVQLKESPKILSNTNTDNQKDKNKFNKAFLSKALKETLEFNTKLNSIVEMQRIQIDNLTQLLRNTRNENNDETRSKIRGTQSFNRIPSKQALMDQIIVEPAAMSRSKLDFKETRSSRARSMPVRNTCHHGLCDASGVGYRNMTSNSEIDVQKQIRNSRETLRRLEIEAEVAEKCYQESQNATAHADEARNLTHRNQQNYIQPKVSWSHILSVPSHINLLSRQLEREKIFESVMANKANTIFFSTTSNVVQPGLVDKPIEELRKMYRSPNSRSSEDILGDYYNRQLSDNINLTGKIQSGQRSFSRSNEPLENFKIHRDQNKISQYINDNTSEPSNKVHEIKNRNSEHLKLLQNNEKNVKESTLNNFMSEKKYVENGKSYVPTKDLDLRREPNKVVHNSTDYSSLSTRLEDVDNNNSTKIMNNVKENEISKNNIRAENDNIVDNDISSINHPSSKHDQFDAKNAENSENLQEFAEDKSYSSNKFEANGLSENIKATNVEKMIQIQSLALKKCDDKSKKKCDVTENVKNLKQEIIIQDFDVMFEMGTSSGTHSIKASNNVKDVIQSPHKMKKGNDISIQNEPMGRKLKLEQEKRLQKIDNSNYSDEEFDETSKAISSSMSIGNVSEQFWD